MSAIKIIFKFIGLAVALLAGQVAGSILAGMLLPAATAAMPAHDGPFDLTQGLLLMTAADAVALALYAARLRGGFIARSAALFALLYMVGSGLSVIETVYFNTYIKLPVHMIEQVALSGLIQALIAAPAAAALWRGQAGEAETVGGIWWRLPLIAAVYIVFYFGAGQFIAWQGAELRAYYDQAAHIDHAQLALLQFGRGLIWAGLAWMSVQGLTGARWPRALVTGIAFSVIMVMPLVIPNPYMLWDVRKMHVMEIASSNLLFGLLAAAILLWGMKGRKA